MNKPQGIVIFGANGSGKTTLGRELAQILNYKHMDIEDYYFEESEIPYTVKRPHEDCLNLMFTDIEKYRSFVLSTVTGDFNDKIQSFYKLAVYLSAPHDLRMERVKKRSYDKHGERVLEGGDMYEMEQEFFSFVDTRPLSKIEQWAETLTCSIIYVDGTKDWRTNAADIADQFLNMGDLG